MALIDVVEKFKDCAIQSKKTGGVIIVDLTRPELTSSDVICIEKDNLQKEGASMFKERTVAKLSNREVNFILNPGKSQIDSVIGSIIENHKCVGKELKSKSLNDGSGWSCHLSHEEMVRLDRKR